MPDLPTGTVTFLFTDIEGSTRLLVALGDRYPPLLEEHARILRTAIAEHGGREVSTEGDAFFAVFTSATDAVQAAADAQRALAAAPWPEGHPIRVRMGIHSGDGRLGGDNYVGIDVHRAARIAAAGHGGQVLLSDVTSAMIAASEARQLRFAELGAYRLKDLDAPERLVQLTIEGLPGAFPPLRAARTGNLPVSPTTFLGRERELAELDALLDAGRLVTLTGPGGAGKTRLAIQAAGRAAERFGDGAYLVGLDAVREAHLVPTVVAKALGLPDAPDRDPADQVREHLAGLEVLLVLDNFEQVLPAAAFVDAVLKAAPRATVMVTSRAPLQLYGEQQYPVGPLGVPDPAHLPPAADLSQYEAVALFIARARAVRPQFEVTAQNAPAVAEICVRLDGLPLAIELAAARVKLLTPDAILARLGARLEFLATTATNLPERQRSVRGAIAWSYDLLTDAERRLLERLAVFAGGADLDAAEAVCNADGSLGKNLLDGLASLVDNSLVRRWDAGEQPRFGLLETIREFGLERLAARGEEAATRGRHAAYLLALVESAEPHLASADEPGWYERLATDNDNLRAALRWALDSADASLALRLVAAAWRFWQREGLLNESRWWIDEAFKLSGSEARSRERARARSAQASIAYWQNDAALTRAGYEEALDIYRALDDAEGIARGTYNLGFAHLMTGDRARALALFEESQGLFEARGDRGGVEEAALIQGYQAMLDDDLPRARSLLERAVELAGSDKRRRVEALISLGLLHRKLGVPTARRTMLDALRLLRETRDLGLTAGVLEVIAAVDITLGACEEGVVLKGAVDALRERMGGGPTFEVMLVEAALAEARDALGDDAVEAALARGRELSVEEAIDRTLASA